MTFSTFIHYQYGHNFVSLLLLFCSSFSSFLLSFKCIFVQFLLYTTGLWFNSLFHPHCTRRFYDSYVESFMNVLQKRGRDQMGGADEVYKRKRVIFFSIICRSVSHSQNMAYMTRHGVSAR